jgi:DNA-binding GntR family transcriptional regulator
MPNPSENGKSQSTRPVSMSRQQFAVPQIELHRAAGQSLASQIQRQIEVAIRSGTIAHGVKLPSTRMFAKLLHVSRGTVTAAYESLFSEGLVQVQPRSGIHVNGVRPPASILSELRQAVRSAQFPFRTQPIRDPDGTILYLNIR